MSTALRVAGVIAWLAATFGLILVGSTAAWIGAALVTVLAGALLARWWVVLAPIALGVFWVIAGAVSDDDSGEADPIVYGVMSLVVCLGFALLLALGVGLTKLARRPATQRAADRLHRA